MVSVRFGVYQVANRALPGDFVPPCDCVPRYIRGVYHYHPFISDHKAYIASSKVSFNENILSNLLHSSLLLSLTLTVQVWTEAKSLPRLCRLTILPGDLRLYPLEFLFGEFVLAKRQGTQQDHGRRKQAENGAHNDVTALGLGAFRHESRKGEGKTYDRRSHGVGYLLARRPHAGKDPLAPQTGLHLVILYRVGEHGEGEEAKTGKADSRQEHLGIEEPQQGSVREKERPHHGAKYGEPDIVRFNLAESFPNRDPYRNKQDAGDHKDGKGDVHSGLGQAHCVFHIVDEPRHHDADGQRL